MTAARQVGWAAVVVAALGFLAPAVRAGCGCNCDGNPCGGPGCPPNCYSPLNYWAPLLYRWEYGRHCPRVGMYACLRYPGVPIQCQVLYYRCPGVDAPTYAAGYGGPPPAINSGVMSHPGSGR